MKQEDDHLKNILNDAFEAENIAFSEASWNEMNSMLDATSKRRGAGFWVSGMGILLILSGVSAYFIANSNEYVYQPRISSINTALIQENEESLAETINDYHQPEEAKFEKPSEKTLSKSNSLLSKPSESKKEPPVDKVKLANNIDSKSNVKITLPTESDAQDTKEVAENNPIALDVSAIPSDSDDKIEELSTAIEIEEKRTAEADINLMPILNQVLDQDPSTIESTSGLDDPIMTENPKWNKYMVFGFSKSFQSKTGLYPGFGQFLGLGTTYKLKHHWYLSGEMLLSRDAVNIIDEQTNNYYGFSKSTVTRQTQTTELIYADLPILLQFRSNRMMFGLGPKFGYLIGVENTDLRIGDQNTQETLQTGYFTWDAFKSVDLGLALDAQYQLNEHFWMGTRADVGLNQISTIDNKIRRSKIELYIKLRIP